MSELLIGYLGVILASLGVLLAFYIILVNGRENRRTHQIMTQALERIEESAERIRQSQQQSEESAERIQKSLERVEDSARHIAELVVREGEKTREEARHPRT